MNGTKKLSSPWPRRILGCEYGKRGCSYRTVIEIVRDETRTDRSAAPDSSVEENRPSGWWTAEQGRQHTIALRCLGLLRSRLWFEYSESRIRYARPSPNRRAPRCSAIGPLFLTRSATTWKQPG